MYVIGLTGGIASGKTTTLQYFQKQHIPIIDADIIAREVVKPGTKALNAIEKTFGSEYLQSNGELNRQKLATLIFANSNKRQQLDAIMQPIIRHKIEQELQILANEKKLLVVLEMPLLIEMDYLDLIDELWVVYVTEDIQMQRLIKRNNLSSKEAAERIHSQMPLKKKLNYADVVLDNNGSQEQLYQQITVAYQQLKHKLNL